MHLIETIWEKIKRSWSTRRSCFTCSYQTSDEEDNNDQDSDYIPDTSDYVADSSDDEDIGDMDEGNSDMSDIVPEQDIQNKMSEKDHVHKNLVENQDETDKMQETSSSSIKGIYVAVCEKKHWWYKKVGQKAWVCLV